MAKPKIWQQTEIFDYANYRVVLAERDQHSWPGGFDLTLEHRSQDATGVERWDYVDSFYLTPEKRDKVYAKNKEDQIKTILKLLLGIKLQET